MAADEREPEVISLKYDGGLAATNQLHLYEFGRAQYAFSRFIIAIEHFRKTGEVIDRVNKSNYVEILVRSPERGSFVEDVVFLAAQNVAAGFVSIPFTALMSYVWQLLSPLSEKTEQVTQDVARTLLAEEREHTRQIKSIEEIVKSGNATNQQALALLQRVIDNPSLYSFRGEFTQDDVAAAKADLLSAEARQQQFDSYEEELGKIDEQKLALLTSRVRPMVGEIALPLKRSATTMSLGVAKSERSICFLDKERAEAIQRRKLAENEVIVICHIHSYDRDGGYGKLSSELFGRTLNFSVTPRSRKTLLSKVLQAMTVDKVKCVLRLMKDDSGIVTSVVLQDINASPALID
jgi:hypothetical protein